ncbi:MAG: DNA repair protein RecN [Deltaproteobacteria bacterium]|nr:DNA repair protein RecN [Deltaproteobacteria bacterium]
MLLDLRIKNFAIIDKLHLSLGPGMNIFTGETGAGKSIIIDAIKLILGDRAASDLIRSSEEEAVVEAQFDISAYRGVVDVLDESGLPCNENLLIKRVVSRSGRNKVFINDSMATLVTLAELGGRLIDIFGQSEHQSLTRPEEHIETLDAFCGLGKLRRDMSQAYRRLASLQGELEKLAATAKRDKERYDLLSHQSKEIEDAALREGEEEELRRERDLLLNAEKLFAAASDADGVLYSSEGAVLERLGRVINKLSEVVRHDERLKPHMDALKTCGYQIEEAAAFFRDYAGSITSDQERLDEIGRRMDLLLKLKNKYGGTVEEITGKREAMVRELGKMEQLDGRIDELRGGVDDVRKRAFELAVALSKKRGEGALKFKKEVEEELNTLEMGGTIFDVMVENEVTPSGTPKLGEKGINKVTFFLSPNPGEEPKPLARIASGGELSRIMLAMKRVAATGRVPTIIFDEVDAGIGGGVAEVIGRKLREVSRKHQVICITHLAQIAAYGDLHCSVFKETIDGRTFARIKELRDEEIVDEYARMLGGVEVTEKTRDHARELYERVRGER